MTMNQEQELRPVEMSLIRYILAREGYDLTTMTVTRRSDRLGDVSLQASRSSGVHLAAWLPLLAIRNLTLWTLPTIADMTDYPEMAVGGDWSAVRDSTREKIWLIFEKFVMGGGSDRSVALVGNLDWTVSRQLETDRLEAVKACHELRNAISAQVMALEMPAVASKADDAGANGDLAAFSEAAQRQLSLLHHSKNLLEEWRKFA